MNLPPVAVLAIALAVSGVSFGTAWKIQDGNITTVKLKEMGKVAKGWESATRLLLEEQERSRRAVAASQTEARRLRDALRVREQEFESAIREPGVCQDQASQPLLCPSVW